MNEQDEQLLRYAFITPERKTRKANPHLSRSFRFFSLRSRRSDLSLILSLSSASSPLRDRRFLLELLVWGCSRGSPCIDVTQESAGPGRVHEKQQVSKQLTKTSLECAAWRKRGGVMPYIGVSRSAHPGSFSKYVHAKGWIAIDQPRKAHPEPLRRPPLPLSLSSLSSSLLSASLRLFLLLLPPSLSLSLSLWEEEARLLFFSFPLPPLLVEPLPPPPPLRRRVS